VQVFQSKSDFGTVEFDSFGSEFMVFLEMIKEFAAIDVVHNEVEFVACLERVVEIDEERMSEFLKDVLFSFGMFEFVVFEDVFLVEDFHGVDTVVVFLANLEYFSETAFTDDTEKVKVFDANFLGLIEN
jgi:chromatin segregation and condensation protein Rec8/ScpA/Scc1 (kleisin family)